ncbi:MAG: LytR/AlgR family response regulator transcription factor [Oscillospiraceae bacterium]
MLKIAICDDDALFRSRLIEQIKSVERPNRPFQFDEFSSGETFLNGDSKHDVVFMDIQMGEENINGYMTAEVLRQRNENVVLVFCSGIEGGIPAEFVHVKASDFILKSAPVEENIKRLTELFNKLAKQPVKMTFRLGQSLIVANLDDVLYFTRHDRKMWIKRIQDTDQELAFLDKAKLAQLLFSDEKMEEIYAKVSPYWFEYTNSRYLVNLRYVTNLSGRRAYLSNGQVLGVARDKDATLRKRLIFYTESGYV